MKKPEPPKEFDEEIVLAKVRISNCEMGCFYSNKLWRLQITRQFFKLTAFNFRLKNMPELVVDLQEKREWS